jgi:hypothetical protein
MLVQDRIALPSRSFVETLSYFARGGKVDAWHFGEGNTLKLDEARTVWG